MVASDLPHLLTALRYAHASSPLHDHVEIHPVDSSAWIIFEAKIDMLRDPEAEVASRTEIFLTQFVFLHLETAFKDLFSLLSAHCHMAGNLLITSNRECTHSIACLGEDR